MMTLQSIIAHGYVINEFYLIRGRCHSSDLKFVGAGAAVLEPPKLLFDKMLHLTWQQHCNNIVLNYLKNVCLEFIIRRKLSRK